MGLGLILVGSDELSLEDKLTLSLSLSPSVQDTEGLYYFLMEMLAPCLQSH
jgi:hypothetical protein